MDLEQNQSTETTTETSVEKEYSPIEQKALELGWRPKEEFDGDDEAFIDAKEFVRRQPLFDKISSQSREIKEVRKALDAFKQHYTVVQESAYQKALKELKSARAQAVSEGDGEKFDALDAEVKSVEKQVEVLKYAQVAPVSGESHPEFEAWQNQNRWYSTTKYMREYADEYGAELHKKGYSPAEVLKAVSEAVKKEFPHKFVNPNKETALPTQGGTKSTRKVDNFESTLSQDEKRVMDTLVRANAITKEKYLADLKKIKGL